MKLLLYCTKAKPFLYDDRITQGGYNAWYVKDNFKDSVNGKIVGECDFEVEKIINCGNCFRINKYKDLQKKYAYSNKIARESCLDYTDMKKYLGDKNGYAIHIKNLHIFDEPRELSYYHSQAQVDFIVETELWRLKNGVKAPQNMCYAYNYNHRECKLDKYVLISIRPQWLCKILNGEKTIEVRRKVLKEMK